MIFLVCWVPFFTLNITQAFCLKYDDSTKPTFICTLNSSEVGSVTVWLGYINSFLNPIIYTIFNIEFRRAFKKLLHLSWSGDVIIVKLVLPFLFWSFLFIVIIFIISTCGDPLIYLFTRNFIFYSRTRSSTCSYDDNGYMMLTDFWYVLSRKTYHESLIWPIWTPYPLTM